MIIEGSISVKAAIEAKKREIQKVYINKSKKTKDFNYIRRLCVNNNISIEELAPSEIEKLASGKTFGGVLAEVDVRKEDTITDGDIFVIDGVEDPFNLGYMARTLYAFGVKNIILPKRDYSFMEGQIIKSSAGTFEHINVIYSEDFGALLSDLKKQGYHLYALNRKEGSRDIFDESFPLKSIFIMGGEKRGISSAVEELCDDFLYIPYGSGFRNSLSGISALDVVATLLFGQRK